MIGPVFPVLWLLTPVILIYEEHNLLMRIFICKLFDIIIEVISWVATIQFIMRKMPQKASYTLASTCTWWKNWSLAQNNEILDCFTAFYKSFTSGLIISHHTPGKPPTKAKFVPDALSTLFLCSFPLRNEGNHVFQIMEQGRSGGSAYKRYQVWLRKVRCVGVGRELKSFSLGLLSEALLNPNRVKFAWPRTIACRYLWQ